MIPQNSEPIVSGCKPNIKVKNLMKVPGIKITEDLPSKAPRTPSEPRTPTSTVYRPSDPGTPASTPAASPAGSPLGTPQSTLRSPRKSLIQEPLMPIRSVSFTPKPGPSASETDTSPAINILETLTKTAIISSQVQQKHSKKRKAPTEMSTILSEVESPLGKKVPGTWAPAEVPPYKTPAKASAKSALETKPALNKHLKHSADQLVDQSMVKA